ncbi:hypothetical protein Ccrd_000190 [Cynara cardunculus var. scolymus]|uniref:Uncharacterized protein n=1 Tax=Cynara cardunculus var. scolymus TaxID=59895 RepID=A0A118JXW2_CYNCS|nr:hypothetical protein Ccrd_000190 [Cynara cardunculus var. scolymus]
MAEHDVDEKSDGLDILSIGKLYQGPWEKKYWSSSRGTRTVFMDSQLNMICWNASQFLMPAVQKWIADRIRLIQGKDRHPYPVGYVAIRTNNGNTYKMAILEGLKGPEFVISSTNEQVCSGQTPDIAWDGFQKKSSVRIKFWRGKRFSCKMDGAELFGFKNPLVKKLLRELKATFGQITEHSLPSCSGNGKSEGTHQHHTRGTGCHAEKCKCPDLQVRSVKTQGKEKRAKKRKEVNVKSVSGTEHKRGRPQDLTQSGDGPHCRQSCEGNHNKGIPLCSLNSNENNTGPKTMASNENSLSHLVSAEHSPGDDGVQFDFSVSSEHLEKEKFPAAQEASNSHRNASSQLDVSMFTNASGFTSSKKVDGKGDPPVQKDSQMLDDIDLYAPDTLDLVLDSTCNPEEEIPNESNCTREDKLNGAQILVSEKCITESHSKDEIVIAAGSENSDKSDSDPVGQDIAESMMTLLLPRALPLLKTFSRKKKTFPNCGKKDPQAMSQEERKGTNQCPEDDAPGIATTGDAKSTSAVGFDYAAQKRTRGVTGVGAGNMSSMPSADHVAEKGARCFTGGVGDGSVSFTPLAKDSKGDNVTEISATNASASDSQIDKMRSDEKIYRLPNVRIPTGSNGSSCIMATVATHHDDVLSPNYKFTSDVCGASVSCERQSEASSYTELFEIQGHHDIDGSISISQDQRISHCDVTKMVHNNEDAKDESHLNKLTKMVQKDELENIFDFVGCYLHPTPISMVMLKTKGNEVFICVLCGYLMEKDRTLFVYKACIKGERRGCPSFIGHSTIISPISRNACGGQILLDSSSLQFTPDGKCLVLLNDIKTPYCREGNVNCQCSVCTSNCSGKNAVKVVQVKLGYVQAVCKLNTVTTVCCILVCEPSYLVAAEESGRMNLWTMNSTWSESTEHSYLPTSDCMPNYIVEMKRIPNFPALIVGHSIAPKFYCNTITYTTTKRDLTRRILVSKFSAPGTSFLPFIPINIFRCPSQPFSRTDACSKKQVADIMGETQMWSLERDNNASLPVEEEDLSLVLLVSSVSNLDLNDKHSYKDSGVGPVGCWSLALLAKSKLMSEIALDPSATVAGASAGYGIVGTCDGSLYIWELSTGATVSCLVVDDSDSGAFGVAVDGSQLQVYALGTSANE